MTNQLQSLALSSLNAFKDLFCPEKKGSTYEHPGFITRLIVDGSDIKFEPDFNDYEVII